MPVQRMQRALWKGAIAFGLVHVPVGLYPASHDDSIDFDWLDRRTMDPVGYQRINKRTGKPIDKDDIVKGIKQEDDHYVVLSDEEIRSAYPTTTQTIEIEAFVGADEVPFVHLERPYYLAPVGKSGKVYALLRETLAQARRIGIARVVIQTKQHLAALVPVGPALLLHTLRWPSEIRSWEDLELPPEGAKAAGLNERELQMAQQLVEGLSAPWEPSQYRSTFRDAVMALVQKKREAGDVEAVEPLEAAPQGEASNVVDLTELLKRSLAQGAARGHARSGGQSLQSDAAPRAEKATATATAGKSPARKPAQKKKADPAAGAGRPAAGKQPQNAKAARKRA